MSVTLADGLKNIDDGSAFKDPPSSVNGLTNYGLPTADAAAEGIKQSWDASAKNLSTAVTVSKSNVTLIGIKAKSEGREPTTEELDEACGPLDFLAKAGSDLDEALGGIFTDIGKFASDFGEDIGEFAGKLNKLISDVANAVDEITEQIAKAALELFESVNAVAIQALETIEGAINDVVGFVNDAIAKAEAALDKAINDLLAFADGLTFASIFNLDCQEEAVENAVDSEKVADADEINRVIAPETISGTNDSLTSETLPKPQTEFAQSQTSVPLELNSLIADYRTKIKAFTSATGVDVATAQGLSLAASQAKTNLLIEAANQGVEAKDLPIYGPNYDQLGEVKVIAVGRDRNGDEIVTERITAKGDPVTEELAGGESARLQRDINEIKQDIALYNQLNNEQFQEIRSQKLSILNPFAPKLTGAEVQATNEKLRRARSLRIEIIGKLQNSEDRAAVEQAVGPLDPIREGYF